MTQQYYVDEGKYATYRAQVVTCLTDVLGSTHTYTKTLCTADFVKNNTFANAVTVVGILEALKEELERGYVRTLREVAHAELFSDFVEMAEHLLLAKYKDAAAVIIGSVLEEHLRQLSLKNGLDITVPDKGGVGRPKKASQMNDDLCKAGVYLLTQQKQVTAWLGVRNDAAHGNYLAYTDEQVRLMIQGVISFLALLPASRHQVNCADFCALTNWW